MKNWYRWFTCLESPVWDAVGDLPYEKPVPTGESTNIMLDIYNKIEYTCIS